MRLPRLVLSRSRVAVAGRPALQDVRDVDVGARHADTFEQLLEELPGLADERDAELVLVESRRLADEHQVGARVARAEDDLCPALRESAARAAGDGRRVRLE